VALDDLELSTATVPKGHYMLTLIASANRDPDAFADPDALDLGRDENRHLGFGFGVHHCLGAPLARLEASVAIPAMLRRASAIELATEKVVYRDNVVLRGLAELPVRLSAA
jgi:cytochrome P450